MRKSEKIKDKKLMSDVLLLLCDLILKQKIILKTEKKNKTVP